VEQMTGASARACSWNTTPNTGGSLQNELGK